MIFTIIYTLMEYLNYYMAYRIILNRKFRENIWIYGAVLSCVCLLQIVVKLRVDDTWQEIILLVTGFSIPLLWIKKPKLIDIALFPIVCFGTSVINILGSYLIAIFLRKGVSEIIVNPFYTFMAEWTAIIMLFIIYNIKKRKNHLEARVKWNFFQYLILFTGLIGFIIMIGFAQILENPKDFSIEKIRNTGALVVCVALIFIGLSFWQQITFQRQKEYQLKNEKYENYIRMQEEYVQMLIQKNESLRRFRHDLHAHMTALHAYAAKNQDTELQEYISDIENNSALFLVRRYTGIAAVDAVVSELCHNAQEKEIMFYWHGTMHLSERLAVFDMCTLFYNLLLNAIEACEKLEAAKRRIDVKVYIYENQKLYINIKNPCISLVERNGTGGLETTKHDKENHGFGTKNIEETVKKYDGSVQYRMEDGWFEAEIVMAI